DWVVLAASALLLLRHPRVLRLVPTATSAHQHLGAVNHGGMKVRVEATVRMHLRVTHVVSVGGGLAADRAGAWHRRWTPSGEVNSNVTVAPIVRQFDGAALLRALEAATARLEAGADEVNALNVYPVPDGDTGTNMLHTMRAAVKHAREAEPTIDKVSAAAAYGALMGARGNSGVILSQVIRGLKEAFAGKETAEVTDVRRAAELAREYAYEAVSAPAPGTILSLTASFEKSAAAPADDVVEMFHRIATDAHSTVRRTRDENPTNRAAGVVDAGARGLQLILEGVLSSFTGKEIPLDRMAPAERPAASAGRAAAAPVGVVAVVPGEGFAAVARSLGASALRGGPTMNPSTEELLAAIAAANATTVIVLPNDKNVILAAQQAAKAASIAV